MLTDVSWYHLVTDFNWDWFIQKHVNHTLTYFLFLLRYTYTYIYVVPFITTFKFKFVTKYLKWLLQKEKFSYAYIVSNICSTVYLSPFILYANLALFIELYFSKECLILYRNLFQFSIQNHSTINGYLLNIYIYFNNERTLREFTQLN